MGLQSIIDDFEFLDDWDDRYKYIIDIRKTLNSLSEGEYNDTNKVDGCASQVWFIVEEKVIRGKNVLKFRGDSDAFIVKGLIVIIFTMFSEKTPEDILKIDFIGELRKLQLQENISQQRSNGLTAMINTVISEAQKRV